MNSNKLCTRLRVILWSIFLWNVTYIEHRQVRIRTDYIVDIWQDLTCKWLPDRQRTHSRRILRRRHSIKLFASQIQVKLKLKTKFKSNFNFKFRKLNFDLRTEFTAAHVVKTRLEKAAEKQADRGVTSIGGAEHSKIDHMWSIRWLDLWSKSQFWILSSKVDFRGRILLASDLQITRSTCGDLGKLGPVQIRHQALLKARYTIHFKRLLVPWLHDTWDRVYEIFHLFSHSQGCCFKYGFFKEHMLERHTAAPLLCMLTRDTDNAVRQSLLISQVWMFQYLLLPFPTSAYICVFYRSVVFVPGLVWHIVLSRSG